MPLPPVVDTLLSSPLTDLLRLLAVPVLGWAAYRDVATRRVPNETWVPLVALGVVLLVADAAGAWGDPYRRQLFVVHVVVSLGLVAPLGYVFWRIGGFGGADAKAVVTLALLFPEYPTYFLPSGHLPLPAFTPPLSVFSLTILTNTVVLGVAYPFALAGRNLLRGRIEWPMFVGRPVSVSSLPDAYGRLLETPDGFTRRGLDVDALRMYLRWRGLTLSELRAHPDRYRDPLSLPPDSERGDPGDGAVADGPPVADGGRERPRTDDRFDGGDDRRAVEGERESTDGRAATPERGDPGGSRVDASRDPAAGATPAVSHRTDPADPWGAAEFIASLDGDAYGTTPDALRDGLAVVAREDEVWLTPGIPFIVPMFGGLVVALTVGDLLYVAMTAVGAV